MPTCAMMIPEPAPPPPRWVEVRDPQNPSRLLCRYDPTRQLLEIVFRGQTRLIDLTALTPPAAPHSP